MFLAPLNYDRFFKKVFGDLKIAKAFIEDFLDVEIESIEELDQTKSFTDRAAIVEFDYRCKIDGRYVIIDMQQWYKPDVTQRFFLYHALNTGLQLESLPAKKLIVDKFSGKTKVIKDYRRVEPVSTLVWMVDDTLNFDVNFISYQLLPHTVVEFLQKEKLWHKAQIVKLLQERAKVLEQVANDHKELDFLPQNALVFMFQKNIVKDTKLDKYMRWFRFAEKTRNPNNIEEDFLEFRGDGIFEEIISRISTSILKTDDFEYIENEQELIDEITRWETGKIEEGRKEGRREGKREGRDEGRLEAQIEFVIRLIQKGNRNVEELMDLSGLDRETVIHILEDFDRDNYKP